MSGAEHPRAVAEPTPGPFADEEPPVPVARQPWARLVAVLAVVAVVVAAVAGTLALRGDGGEADGVAPSSDGTGGAVAGPGELDAVVVELSAFVVDERGRSFLHPVDVTLLDGEAFRARVLEGAAEGEAELRRTQRVLAALGMIGPDVDLVAAVRELWGASVLGFYDPRTDELVVRGGAVTPLVRSVLVHELVHALDDQHFDLHRPSLVDTGDERATALRALEEGTAVWVEERYREGLAESERAAIRREEAALAAGIDLDGVPEVLVGLQQFPYLAGPELVQALVAAGGRARLDAAFADPPTTTEHVLHPDAFLAGEAPVPVTPPSVPDGGEAVDEGVVGEWVLLLLLSRDVPVPEAREAAAGWGGDRYVAWDDAGRTCVAATVAADTRADLGELTDALERWADEHPDAAVRADGDGVALRACG